MIQCSSINQPIVEKLKDKQPALNFHQTRVFLKFYIIITPHSKGTTYNIALPKYGLDNEDSSSSNMAALVRGLTSTI